MSDSVNSGGPPVYDRVSALAHLDGDANTLGELAQMFVARCPELLNRIASSIRERDATTLRQATHLLNGSLTTFFAERAIRAVKSLAEAGKAHDWQLVAIQFETAKKELALLTESLQPPLDSDSH